MGGEEGARIEAAGAVVYRLGGREPEFLLLRNARHRTWAPPKGHLEPGESREEAARREIAEELGPQPGLVFRPGFRERTRYPVQKGGRTLTKEVTWYLARHGGDPLTLSEEHDQLAWADPERAGELLAHPGLRELLAGARAFLRQHPGGAGVR